MKLGQNFMRCNICDIQHENNITQTDDHQFPFELFRSCSYDPNRIRSTKGFFFLPGFFTQTFTNHRTAAEGGGHIFNSSLPLSPVSQTLRHQLGDYCRELTSAHSQQSNSNREPLVSERKSLTAKLRALKRISSI